MSQELVELFGFGLGPLPRGAFGSVRQSDGLPSFLGGEFGHLVDYVLEGLGDGHFALSADALTRR